MTYLGVTLMDEINYVPYLNNQNPTIYNPNVRAVGVNLLGNIQNNTPRIFNGNVNTIAEVRPDYIRDTSIEETRNWIMDPPQAIPIDVPVTVQAGTPIVNMPGCVKVHKENAKNPKNTNNQLVNDDPKQNVVLCDAGMPYYEPPEYDYRDLTWQTVTTEEEETETTKADDPEDIDTPTPPPPPETPLNTAGEPECPPPNARRIGDLNQAGTEKVTGYKLSVDKKTCITEWEDVTVVEQYLPSLGTVSTTATIAIVATTSALLAKPIADLILKVVKPIVKKTIAKVKKILGKESRRPNRSERMTDSYREKKGMLPLKKK